MRDLVGADADNFVAMVLPRGESKKLETKRVSGKMVHKALETICAFANTDGGMLVLGIEDLDKAKGNARLFGIEENLDAVDELQRKLNTHFVPPLGGVVLTRIACRLRDGSAGHLLALRVAKSDKVHSILDDGTWTRLERGNRSMSATEVVELSFKRGERSTESDALPVSVDLLDTAAWRTFAGSRGFLSGSVGDRLYRIGLAKKSGDDLLPTRAAILLFADEPGALLAAHGSRADIRVFHYRGNQVEHGSVPNLKKTPKTISGAIYEQIERAHNYVLEELAEGLTLASSGFKTVHRYPERVIKEAITNAVIHRDYRLNRDIHIRIFDNRIELESPGLLPGRITPSNIERAGSFARNPLLASNLREFPVPPNIDAGEGVRMMFATMRENRLYPPLYLENQDAAQPTVTLILWNEERPPVWEQVSDWIDRNGPIANADLCKIADIDTLKASKLLKRWVAQGVLVADTTTGKRNRVYRKPSSGTPDGELPLLSEPMDNKTEET